MPQELSPWNPLHQGRLLWWLFIHPERFAIYRERVGEDKAQRVAVGLANTLIWLPLFIAASGLTLSLERRATLPLDISFPAWTALILIGWIIASRVPSHPINPSRFNVVLASEIGVGFGITFALGIGFNNYIVICILTWVVAPVFLIAGVAYLLALGITLRNTAILMAGIAAIIASGLVIYIAGPSFIGFPAIFVATIITCVTAFVVGRSIETRRAPRLNWLFLCLLIGFYLALIWLYGSGEWNSSLLQSSANGW